MFPTSRSRELGIPLSRTTRQLRRSQEQHGQSRRTPLLEPLETRSLLSLNFQVIGSMPDLDSDGSNADETAVLNASLGYWSSGILTDRTFKLTLQGGDSGDYAKVTEGHDHTALASTSTSVGGFRFSVW